MVPADNTVFAPWEPFFHVVSRMGEPVWRKRWILAGNFVKMRRFWDFLWKSGSAWLIIKIIHCASHHFYSAAHELEAWAEMLTDGQYGKRKNFGK